MSNEMQPRIRGQAYQKDDKTWSWEAVVTFGDMSTDDPEAIVINKKESSFLNRESAVDDLRKSSVEISKEIGKSMGANEKDLKDMKYIDLTKGFSAQDEKEFLGKSPFGKKFY